MNSILIYIGAGDGKGIDAVLDEATDRLILIEPNPKLASKLRLKFENLKGVEVHELAVAATNSEKRRELIEYNWNKASSIAETKELSLAYPGLKKINSYPVECIGIEELVEKLNLNNSDTNSLVIEAPGVEGEIIDALCQSGKVSLFEQLEITCPLSGFYATETKEEDVVTQLKQFGLELKFRDSDDPDWQTVVVEKNKWLDELIASRNQISELTIRLDQLTTEKEEQVKLASDRQAQLEQLTKEKEEQAKLASERQAQLEQANKTKDEQAKLAADREVQLEQLTKEKEEQSKLVFDLQAQLEQANRTKDEQSKQASERQAQIEELTNEKESLNTRISELESALTESREALEANTKTRESLDTEKAALEKQVSDTIAERDNEAHWHQESKKWAEDLQQQVEQLKEELKEGSRSVALGQKMLAKSQVDLDHLRDSYAEKVASEQELIELVNELREKLTLASRYYFDLQKEHPEILIPSENS